VDDHRRGGGMALFARLCHFAELRRLARSVIAREIAYQVIG
jgi:hypothetical protein